MRIWTPESAPRKCFEGENQQTTKTYRLIEKKKVEKYHKRNLA